MAAADKDTIYIDIDDEITTVIDKLHGSDAKLVALVLPKRAAVFQSIVNMKLLKRAADSSKKNMVLITTEAGLLPLAGAAGIHVAKSLTSKPEIPSAPTPDDGHEEEVEESMADDEPAEVTKSTAGSTAIGTLAGLGGAAAADEVETVELDNDDEADAAPAAVALPAAKAVKKDKKLHIPDFDRFRLLLVGGGVALIALIIFLIIAMTVLPAATINIKTDATNVNAALNLNLSTTAKTVDTSSNTLPAKLVQQAKTYTQQAATTGTKNEGDAATGTVVFYNCNKDDLIFGQNETIPKGTGITNGGRTYITKESVSVPPSHFQSNGSCKNDAASGQVDIAAQSPGSSYNTNNNVSFSVAYSDPTPDTNGNTHTFSASGSASGGTDNNVQVVSQSDIDNAKGKINTDDPTVKQALQTQLQQDNYYAVAATFSAGTPTVTTSSNVGDAASTVTVTEAVTYTMFGVQENDLKTLVDNNVKGQIDTSKQSILSEGLENASFTVQSQDANSAQVSMTTVAEAGPQIDTNVLKNQVKGLKSADVKALLQNDPDVTDVSVKFSPFWVSSVPKKTSKITINIAKPTTTVKSNANSQ